MTIERKTKCKWIVNGTEVDIRKWNGFNYSPARRAFILAMEARNPNLKRSFIDRLFCNAVNRSTETLRTMETLEWQKAFLGGGQ